MHIRSRRRLTAWANLAGSKKTTTKVLLPFNEQAKELLSPLLLQRYLRADILRRYTELTLLGWLGRGYLTVPFLFDRFFPTLFNLTQYRAGTVGCYQGPGVLDCTLKEGTIGGPKGIPFRLILDVEEPSTARFHVKSARLLSIGCDLREGADSVSAKGIGMSAKGIGAICDSINTDSTTKRLVVEAITSAIFSSSNIAEAAKQEVELEACAGTFNFTPREEFWGLEGSSYKWVQEVSGYFFASSVLQEIRFARQGPLADASSGSSAVKFIFYLDPTEPFNSEDPTKIINPEVITCVFGDVDPNVRN